MKDLKIAELLKIYGGLLTKNQKEISFLYYDCDLSLGEIAENKDISRQSVNDTLTKARNQLNHFENKLKMYDKSVKIKNALSNTEYKQIIDKILEDN